MLDFLNLKLQLLFNSLFYVKVIEKMAYVNVLAILPQTWTAWTAPNIHGINAGMWATFVFIQIIFLLEAIRVKSRSMAGSMALSIPQSLAIIAAVWIRG